MAKTKHRPGIHLFKGKRRSGSIKTDKENCDIYEAYYYWHTQAKNGRITANGETYKTKGGALDGISSAAKTLGGTGRFKYYDHTQPDSPLKSYL